MIQVIGVKRVMILMMLLVINGFLSALLYLYMIPEGNRQEQELRILRSQASVVQSDIGRIKVEFEQLDQQQEAFDVLKGTGFFFAQTRSDAKALFSEIQEKSRVISAVANLKSGVLDDNAEAQKAKHQLLTSFMDIELKAFDDSDVFRYIDLVFKMFPGHISIDGINIKRTGEVNAPVLRAISGGASPELITAKLKFSWRTLIPQSQVIDKEDGR